jgi:hypothetical protein
MRQRNREREFQCLLAIVLAPWCIPIALWRLWMLVASSL